MFIDAGESRDVLVAANRSFSRPPLLFGTDGYAEYPCFIHNREVWAQSVLCETQEIGE